MSVSVVGDKRDVRFYVLSVFFFFFFSGRSSLNLERVEIVQGWKVIREKVKLNGRKNEFERAR